MIILKNCRCSFENNLKISEEIDDPAAKISYTFQYDKNGNEVMKSDLTTNFDSHYVYGKTGAIIKSKKQNMTIMNLISLIILNFQKSLTKMVLKKAVKFLIKNLLNLSI
jgi:hypothetical protein